MGWAVIRRHVNGVTPSLDPLNSSSPCIIDEARPPSPPPPLPASANSAETPREAVQTSPARKEEKERKKERKKKKGRGGGKNAQLYISLTRGFSPRGVAWTLETLDPEVNTSRGPNFPDFEIFENPPTRVRLRSCNPRGLYHWGWSTGDLIK